MTVVTIEVKLDERDVQAIESFMRKLSAGESLAGTSRIDSKARQRCKRYGYADYWNGKWSITEAGRDYVKSLES